MRICRRCDTNGEAAKAAQLELAPHGYSGYSGRKVDCTFFSFTAGLEITVKKETVRMKYESLIVCAKNLYDPFAHEFDTEEEKEPETKEKASGPAKCITGQSGSGFCGGAAYCNKEYDCCAQCPDNCNGRCGWIPEKQQEHIVEVNKMVTHWPEELKDIPVPTDTEITGYLYDEERKLREFEKDKGLPHMTIQKQQLIVAGLRLLKKIVENQEG